MSLGTFRQRPVRRRWAIGIALTAISASLLFIIVSAGATVPPSGFEGNDGNILLGNNGTAGSNPTPPGNGTEDWATLSPAATRIPDSTSNTDDSLGKGSKEDDLVPNVVAQSVPPKDDLSDVFLATEHFAPTGAGGNCPTASFPNGCIFLYQSSIRTSSNGSANLNVELNQSSVLSPNGKTPNRTDGDKLITFDFTAGGTKATITELTWQSSGGTCADSNDSPPCWENQVTLDANTAEGVANDGQLGRSGALTAAQNPLTNAALDVNTFQEMSVNLTKAGILPATGCTGFAGESVKSRSSGSTGTFNSALKDIVIGHQDIQTCGTITIIKHTDPAGLSQDFGFTSTIPTNSGTPPSPNCSPDTSAGSFTLNDGSSSTNTEDCPSLQAGTYTVTEGADPAGFGFVSVTCAKPAGDPSTFSTSGKTATINLEAEGHVTCTYINKRLTGAIKVTKTTKKPGFNGVPQPQAGVSFTVEGVTKQTGADGTVCFDGLSFGSHDVTETVPSGYQADGATTKSVTVDTATTCAANPYVGNTVAFSNSPLTDVTISVDSKADGGTASTVDCSDNSLDFSTGANGDGTKTSNAIAGSKTITCTITIDP